MQAAAGGGRTYEANRQSGNTRKNNDGYSFYQGQHASGDGGGGGGGFYGGWQGYDRGANWQGGAQPSYGGSGYAWMKDTAKYYPSGCLLKSDWYMQSVSYSTIVNNNNNGYCRITCHELYTIKLVDFRKNTDMYKDSKVQESFDWNILF